MIRLLGYVSLACAAFTAGVAVMVIVKYGRDPRYRHILAVGSCHTLWALGVAFAIFQEWLPAWFALLMAAGYPSTLWGLYRMVQRRY